MPSTSVQKASPRVHLLKTKRISKALASEDSIFSISVSPKPLALRAA